MSGDVTHKGSFKSNSNGAGGLLGDCQNKAKKGKKIVTFLSSISLHVTCHCIQIKVFQKSLLPSFNLVSSGKECKSCSACMKKQNQNISKMKSLHLDTAATVHTVICITFLLKYFSNLRRPMATHCSHWLGRLLSSLMTWKEPSGLSPLCILYIHRSAGIFIQCKKDA